MARKTITTAEPFLARRTYNPLSLYPKKCGAHNSWICRGEHDARYMFNGITAYRALLGRFAARACAKLSITAGRVQPDPFATGPYSMNAFSPSTDISTDSRCSPDTFLDADN